MGCRQLPQGARHWQKWGVGGAAVSCRELQGNGINKERGETTVRCHEMPEICRNEEEKGGMTGCRKLP